MRRQFFGSAPGALRRVLGMKAWRTSEEGRWVPSLRHVSLRETGWSRNPTSSGRTRLGSKGKATHGDEVRIHAFPLDTSCRSTRAQYASQRECALPSGSAADDVHGGAKATKLQQCLVRRMNGR